MTLLLPLALGCAMGPYGAPDGSTIDMIQDDAGWVFDMAYNDADDGVGLLIRETAFVEGPVGPDGTVLPLNDILVEITSGWNGAYVIPAGAVMTVTDAEDGCDGDASEECTAWFAANEGRYVEFSGEYQDLGGFRPTYMAGATDRRGLLDFYIFIDSVPETDEGTVIQIPVYADIGVDIASWAYDFDN